MKCSAEGCGKEAKRMAVHPHGDEKQDRPLCEGHAEAFEALFGWKTIRLIHHLTYGVEHD